MTTPPLLRRDLRASRRHERRKRAIRDAAIFVGACVIISIILQTFIVRGFWVPSPSMVPTLSVQDRILADEITPRFTGYHPGDIIVFRDPDGWLSEDDGDFLVKRVIAVGGDTVRGVEDGTIQVNGETLNEPWVDPAQQQPFAATVPDGELWVMGDNRGNSADSRVHGAVPESDVVGRVFWVYWPLANWGAP